MKYRHTGKHGRFRIGRTYFHFGIRVDTNNNITNGWHATFQPYLTVSRSEYQS